MESFCTSGDDWDISVQVEIVGTFCVQVDSIIWTFV